MLSHALSVIANTRGPSHDESRILEVTDRTQLQFSAQAAIIWILTLNADQTNASLGVKLVTESFNDSWQWAVDNNGDIPLLVTQASKSTINALPSWMKKLLRRYACFASGACEIRELTGQVPPEWQTSCQLRSKRVTYYAPRWTWPIFYFRGSTSNYFRGKKGLDVGARINYLAGIHKGLEAVANYSRISETLVPHFEYYSLLGSDMTAIDINAPDPNHEEIQHGDARLLSLASESFHFATIAMILGPTNPCGTYLEVALSLCELKRVLQASGLLYIAEVGFQTSVCFVAQCLGFDVFVSKGSPSGLPVGTLLRKRRIEGQPSIFDEIFNSPEVQPLKFHPSRGEVFANCHLLRDAGKVLVSIKDLAPNARDIKSINLDSFSYL